MTRRYKSAVFSFNAEKVQMCRCREGTFVPGAVESEPWPWCDFQNSFFHELLLALPPSVQKEFSEFKLVRVSVIMG